MIGFLRTILHPACYHGHGKEPPFFEGWYFKLVDAGEQHPYAIIPGIFLSHDPDRHHAFVQVLDGVTGHATYHVYSAGEFWAAKDDFELRIGPNQFTTDHIVLEIDDAERRVAGELRFVELKPWPVSLISPGMMGWYAWMPFMECYHGVVSLDHEIQGALTVDGEQIDFTGGRGYIEKDWGEAFPAGYVWIQTNHFEPPSTSLSASIAVIPWLRSEFRGFIAGLWHAGELYRFATYTGAETEKLEITDAHVDWVMRDADYRLEIHATRSEGGLLHAPSRVEMHKRVDETLQSTVDVRLTALRDSLLVFSGVGRNAGLEVVGDLKKLLEMER